jgi:hypothetical protein
MTNHIELFLGAEDDDEIIQPLINFFEPIAPTTIHKPDLVVKSIEPIEILITIAASWASKRFVLDPLADRAAEWWKGISYLWTQSNAKRQLGITINFQFPDDKFHIIIDETSDPIALKHIWNYIKKINDSYAEARDKGIQIDKIRLIPDGTSDMLVIAYRGNRPMYMVNLEEKSLKPIKTSSSEETTTELWKLNILIKRLDYLNMLNERGYIVSEEEVNQLENEINIKKGNLR